VELQRLVPHHVLKQFFGWLEIVPGPVEGVFAFWLCLFVVEALEVGVL